MNISVQDDDCAIEAVTHPKMKKLKQGIFIFKFVLGGIDNTSIYL